MKNLFLGLLLVTSFSAFAQASVVDQYLEQGLICSQEDFVTTKIYEQLRKDPTNASLRTKLGKAQAVLVKCVAKAYDFETNDCSSTMDTLFDNGILCSREQKLETEALEKVKQNDNASTRAALQITMAATIKCVMKADKVCN